MFAQLVYRLRLVALLCLTCLAQAHPMPSSYVFLDVADGEVKVEMRLPADRLAIAYPQQAPLSADQLVGAQGDALRRYLLQHVSIVDGEGRQWRATAPTLSIEGAAPATELHATIRFAAPPGVTRRDFTLHYDVITHQLLTHSALVYLRQDWLGGQVGDKPQLLGTLRYLENRVEVKLASGGLWHGLRSVILLGFQHIVEGTDHLLFLFTLLLPAPLLVSGGRWQGWRGGYASTRRLAWMVSAFTLGHSITLLLGGLALLVVPAPWVEVAVACTIIVSAMHALRPLFPGLEMAIAALFGLVHGMAFAGGIAGLGLGLGQRLLTILGFNLGIELMQLAVLVLALPVLLWVAKCGEYRVLRVGGALFSMVLAVAWCIQRLGAGVQVITPLAAHLESLAPWLILVLALLGAACGQRRMLAARASF